MMWPWRPHKYHKGFTVKSELFPSSDPCSAQHSLLLRVLSALLNVGSVAEMHQAEIIPHVV